MHEPFPVPRVMLVSVDMPKSGAPVVGKGHHKAPGYLFTLDWPVYLPGGVNEAVLGLALQLPSHGFCPTIAVTTWERQPQPALTRGIEVINLRLREPVAQNSGLRLLPGFLRTLPFDLYAIFTLLRNRNIQVINAHFPTLDVALFAILKALGLYRGKFVLTFHGADLTEICKTTGLVRKIWKLLITHADGVVTCSNALLRDLLQFAPQSRATAIHNGADTTLFAGIPRTHRSPIRHILHIGKFEHKKSQDTILLAFKRLLESHPECTLLLVGATGPQLGETRALIRDLDLEKQVELQVDVPHDRIPAIMGRADLFLLPSRIEPFGIVLLEAGASGLSVIATNVGGIPELLEHERTGLLIEADKVEELESAMRRLIEDPRLASELGARWHERVMANWSWEITCEKYLRTIERW